MGTVGPFPGVKHGRGVMLTTHALLLPRVRRSRSHTSSPSKRLHGVYQDSFISLPYFSLCFHPICYTFLSLYFLFLLFHLFISSFFLFFISFSCSSFPCPSFSCLLSLIKNLMRHLDAEVPSNGSC
jgi:hypothetical protein